MIHVSDKSQCCGCAACAQRCPKHCITMQQDKEGFPYPQVDADTCVDCKLCEKSCPMLAPKQGHEPSLVIAAKNPSEAIRRESSSGGVFTMLAESIIKEEGVVFGARWSKEWNVEHSYTETIKGLEAFRSSKYVQSDMSDCFLKAEAFLKQGRKVLFSGTPCQIAGLKAFLRKDYENLITVECVCHGVPSPGLWRKYLAEVSTGKEISSINHRDKRTGWRNYSVVMEFANGSVLSEHHDENLWTRAFIKNISLRPSCYKCAFKTFMSQADISLADLWGERKLMPGQSEDKGITLVIARSPKGKDAVNCIKSAKDLALTDVVPFNGAIAIPPREHPGRAEFMSRFQNGESFTKLVKSMTKDPLVLRMKIMISKLIK